MDRIAAIALAISPNGSKLGIGVYYTPDSNTIPWRVYSAILKAWQKPQLTSLDENNPVSPAGSEPPGDYMGTTSCLTAHSASSDTA